MDDEMREVARAIRPYLPDLVGTDAPAADRRLAELLAEDGDVEIGIDEVLRSSPALVAWAQDMLSDPLLRPAAAQQLVERLATGGDGELVDAERFTCPNGDYTWYRISVVVVVPACPTHKIPLSAA
jgi:hypothetical protein